jgi:hypothetical protein
MVANLTTLPRTLLIAGALAIAPAFAFAQTAAPVATVTSPAAASVTNKPVVPPAKTETAVKPVTAPVKPAAQIDSKTVDPKLQPAKSTTIAPTAPKS